MTAFNKHQTQLEEIEKSLTAETWRECHTKLQELEPFVEKYYKKSQEKDEDKKIYGPNMIARVCKLYELFQSLQKQIEGFKSSTPQEEEETELEKQKKEEEKIRKEEEEAKLICRADKDPTCQCNSCESARALEARRSREMAEAARLEYEQQQRLQQKRKLENQQRLKEEQLKRKEEEEKRLQAEKTPFPQFLDSFLDECSQDQKISSLKVLYIILNNIQKEPSDPQFRHLRVNNAQLQTDLTSFPKGEGCLFSLGFREKHLTHPTEEVYYVLEEPDLAQEMDLWVEWFDNIKNYSELVATNLKDLGENLPKIGHSRTYWGEDESGNQTNPTRQAGLRTGYAM
eukprot:Lithocolla_globosa_v1_NODE_1304_length_2690_cov_9.877040.p1 type:complete len:343 gc:universal NODE_1304_length_2690_cov_9.877040:2328-1300(-)